MNTKLKPNTREEYLKRINLLTEHINAHLAEELDLSSLADMCMFSPYHFHRIMKAFLGEPLKSYINRLRVESAARSLRYTESSIQDIAYGVGYDSPSSFNKVFNQYYGMSPSKFRNDKTFVIMERPTNNTVLNLKKPKIQEVEEKTALYIRLQGNYSELNYGETWQRLWTYVKEHKIYSAGIEHFAVYHDDPQLTEASKLRTDICLVVCKPAEAKGEIGVRKIAGGKYAVFLYQGSYENLGAVYDHIFGKWLPESGYTLRESPCMEKYINNPETTVPDKLKTEIYVAIE